MTSNGDEFVRLRAAQISEEAAGFAQAGAVLWEFFTALTDAGFHRDEALRLTTVWFTEAIKAGSK